MSDRLGGRERGERRARGGEGREGERREDEGRGGEGRGGEGREGRGREEVGWKKRGGRRGDNVGMDTSMYSRHTRAVNTHTHTVEYDK